MFYVKLVNGLPTEISAQRPKGDGVTFARDGKNGWQNRNDWSSYDDVTRIALYLTAMTGKTYLPIDAGSHVSPRFDIIEAPKVGDDVSYGFNGDSYPCGKITRITKSWRIYTDSGKTFNCKGITGVWMMVGGTWFLIIGIVDERNPHF